MTPVNYYIARTGRRSPPDAELSANGYMVCRGHLLLQPRVPLLCRVAVALNPDLVSCVLVEEAETKFFRKHGVMKLGNGARGRLRCHPKHLTGRIAYLRSTQRYPQT